MSESDDRERELARALYDLRWGSKFECGRCGHEAGSQLRSRPRVWSCNACRAQRSVTAGTVLHRCKLALALIFRAAELLTRTESISAHELARELEIRVDTAWALLQRLRAGLAEVDTALQGRVSISQVAVCLRQYVDGARRNEKDEEKQYPIVLVAADEQLRAVAVASADPWFRGPQLLAEHSSADDFTWVADHPLACWMRTVLHLTHRGVTARWLPRYLAAFAAIQSAEVAGESPATATLRAAVRTSGSRFAALRPPKNIWDPSWRLVMSDAKVRLDVLDLPMAPGDRVVLERGHLTVPEG